MRFESKNRIMVYPTLELATRALSWLRDRYRIIIRDGKGIRKHVKHPGPASGPEGGPGFG